MAQIQIQIRIQTQIQTVLLAVALIVTRFRVRSQPSWWTTLAQRKLGSKDGRWGRPGHA